MHERSDPARIAQEGGEHRHDIRLPVGFERLRREGWNRPVGRIAHDPKRREWQAVPRREVSGDMRFHIDRGGPRSGMKARLVGHCQNSSFDARDGRATGKAAEIGEPGHQGLDEGGIGRMAPLSGDDFRGDDDVTRREIGRKTTRDADAHHRAAGWWIACLEEGAQTLRITAGPDGRDARPSGEARLLGETGDGEDGEHGRSARRGTPLE